MRDPVHGRRRHGKAWTLPWLACAVLWLTACHQAGNTTADGGVGYDSDERVEGVERVGDVGRSAWRDEKDAWLAERGVHLTLPDDFPADVYHPRRYRVDSVLELGGTATVSMRAPGHVPALFAEARRMMRMQGWTQTMSAQHSVDNAVLAFEKAQRSATLSFNRTSDPGGVLVSVQVRSL